MRASDSLLGNILLALAWALAHGSLDIRSVAVGFVLGFIVLTLAGMTFGNVVYTNKVIALLRLLWIFLWQLVLASLKVAADIVSPRHKMRPAIIRIDLDAETDQEITILGNMITLTPGSLTLDVSEDRRSIYVHLAYVDDVEKARRKIKEQFEAPLLKVTR